jgi:hypothetical protein
MNKQVLSLGKALSKAEQKNVNGGRWTESIVHCGNGYGFSVDNTPGVPFSPHEICAHYGGYDHMSYVIHND